MASSGRDGHWLARWGDERERIKALEREVRELRQANEILRKASRVDLVTRTNGVLAVNFAQAERAMIVGAH